MTITTEKSITIFHILYGDRHKGGKNPGAKLGKMKDGDKFSLIKIMKELKPVAVGFDDFLKDVAERLKPEGMDKIQSKIQHEDGLSVDEQKTWNEFNSKIAKCVQEELAKEIDFNFTPLSEEGFKELLDSNDFTISEIMALEEVIGQ